MNRVEGTALDAAACKWSVCSLGYLSAHGDGARSSGDSSNAASLPYPALFARLQMALTPAAQRRRQPPLSNRFYWERMAVLEAITDGFIRHHQERHVKVQLISLGAGMSAGLLARRLSAEWAGAVAAALEVDTPAVAQRKRDALTGALPQEFGRCACSDDDT
jgi:O-methyltransferase involved in polyketide biosynthesis